MKKLIISILFTFCAVTMLQAQTKPLYRAFGFAGKDTVRVGEATVNAKGELLLNVGNYRGTLQLIPLNDDIASIRKHLGDLSNIKTQAAFDAAKAYVSDSLPFPALYTSGAWKEYIQQWVGFYANTSPNPEVFADVFVPVVRKVMERTLKQDKQTVVYLAKDLIDFFDQYGLDKAAAQVAAYSMGLDLADERLNALSGRLVTSIMLIGNSAVALDSLKNNDLKNTILIFYETGCSHCDEQLDEFKKHYSELQKKGYRVVSIAADMDETLFKTKAATLPWPDKLCDLKGFEGNNFMVYGVASTPIIYVTDKDGKVAGRYSRLSDIEVIK